MSDDTEAPEHVVMSLVTGHWVAAAVHVAVRLDVFDLIGDGELEIETIAARSGAHAPSLLRLLRALTFTGLLEERTPERFVLGPPGQLLRSDHPGSLKSYALFEGAWPHWQSWGHLAHSVRTGESAYRHLYGKNFYEYCASDPEFGQWFDDALSKISRDPARSLCDEYSFEDAHEVVDVGGGLGTVLAHILERHPQVRGTLLELPPVARAARELLASRGLSSRCRVVEGDFFTSIPRGDRLLAKNILHNWSDDEVVVLLHRMREALVPGGRVLLITLLLGSETDSAWSYLADLEMLHIGGRQRTRVELERLFQRSGLVMSSVQQLATGHFAVEGRPV